MAFKLVRFCGGVPASTTADDAAHALSLTTLTPGGAYRVSEYVVRTVLLELLMKEPLLLLQLVII